MALLEARDLVVEYPRPRQEPVRAVAGVDLDVDTGQIVGLVGESGCGKSTFARAVVGLLPRAAGTVTLDGAPVQVVGRRARSVPDRALQMVFQDPYASLNPRRRVQRQIADGLSDDVEIRPRVEELLDAVGMPADAADRYPHEFSGGQRQRLAVARALAADPSVIVADEVVSSLDASTQAQVANLLVELSRKMGVGLLFISHDLSVVRHIADVVAVMYLGRVVEVAPTAELWEQPRHPYTRALVAAVPQLDADAALPQSLTGEVPDPASPPTGCRFHPRCEFVHDRCRTEDPALVDVERARQAACWLQPEGGPAVDLDRASTVAP